jgi:hypothetical protein
MILCRRLVRWPSDKPLCDSAHEHHIHMIVRGASVEGAVAPMSTSGRVWPFDDLPESAKTGRSV